MDFALQGHDLAIANGDFTLCATDKDTIAQAIIIRLKTMRGEWFLDTTTGIPYFTEVFGHKRNERFIRQLIATAIETVPGVVRIDDFKTEMQADRKMLVSITIDIKSSRLWVKRSKNGLSIEQPMVGDELKLLKRYLTIRKSNLPWLFLSERKQPMTRQNINYALQSAANRAGIGFVNPHMLRHSCGFYLANKGYDLQLIQDYLGHRDPKHTVRYTRVSSHRFEGLCQ